MEMPDPPPVKDEDYPLKQRIKSTPPIPYSAAGDLVNDVNVILVTATDAEFCAVMGQAKPLEGEGSEYHTISLEDHTAFYLAKYGGKNHENKVAIIRTDQGASDTRKILDKVQGKLQAQYVIAVGICYGLREKKVNLGDVIVSKSIVDISKKRAQEGGLIFHQSQNTAGTLYNLFRMSEGFELKNVHDYVKVKPGDIVSETTLVADQKHKDQILKQIPHALGGEMEGAGIMESAGANNFEWIVIKAVADWGDGNKETCKKWQPFAAVAAAKYVWFHLDRKDLKQEKELMQSNGQQHIPEQEKNLRERKVPHSSPTADDNINKSEPPNVSPTSGTCSNFKLIFSCLIISCLIMGVCILVYTYKEMPHESPNHSPPPVDGKDFPTIQRIKFTPPIPYSEAEDFLRNANVILVTANDAEFRAVMGQAKPLRGGSEYHIISLEDYTTFILAKYSKNKVAIIKTDQGARETRKILDKVQGKLQAQYVIAVGICYGLREKKMKLGDVIVSKRIVDHSKKRAKKVDIIFHQSQNTAGTLYNLFKMSGGFALPKSSDDYVNVKPGDIVSETTLVADQKHKDHRILKQIPHALGGEMEGAGIMKLAGANHFEWIVIKAVADWGDGKKKEYEKWQPFAAVAAAKYIWFHLDRFKFQTIQQSSGRDQPAAISQPTNQPTPALS